MVCMYIYYIQLKMYIYIYICSAQCENLHPAQGRNLHFFTQFWNGNGAILELHRVSYQVNQIFNPTRQRRNYWTRLECDFFV